MLDNIGQELNVGDFILILKTYYFDGKPHCEFGYLTALTNQRIKFIRVDRDYASELDGIELSKEIMIAPYNCIRITKELFIAGTLNSINIYHDYSETEIVEKFKEKNIAI
jgi:hypothetical protein